MRFFQSIKTFLRLPANLPTKPEVRRHFKRNFIVNSLDSIFWMFGESFVSVNTILPVFASTLTDSPVLIGLVPALIQAGWFIPQLLMAGYVRRLPRKLPFAKKMGVVERLPFLILPLTAFLLHWIPGKAALWIFMLVIAWRGFASGMVALPWQEVIATVIPAPVRSRFFGVSRMVGRAMGVIGSAVAAVILADVAYPDNYALSFLIGAVIVWVSYYFFTRTIEPEPSGETLTQLDTQEKQPLVDLPAFKAILQRDVNFRNYLTSRVFFQLGSMAAGFLAVYGIQYFALPDEQAAVFSGLLFAGGILGFAMWGIIGDRTGPRTILLISDLMQTVVLLIAFFAPSVWVYYAVFLIFGFAQSGYMIGDLVMGMELGPESERPIYIGLVRTIPGVFILIAPLIGGVLAEWVGYRTMFLVALVFGLVGVAFLVKVKGREKPEI